MCLRVPGDVLRSQRGIYSPTDPSPIAELAASFHECREDRHEESCTRIDSYNSLSKVISKSAITQELKKDSNGKTAFF